MPRKMIVQVDGRAVPLEETKAENELELQALVKNNPDLLPIEEFGMTGPLLVVGRETTLPSGAVDLVAIARSGEILVIEFKTGPENSDFRRVLAQLLDYGSDLWSLTFDEFEVSVATRYYSSHYCEDSRLRNLESIDSAARAIWTDATDDEMLTLRERIERQLATGRFSYVVVAQRFTDTVVRTADYLNEIMAGARAYAVEIVKFDGKGVTAFETRTVLKPNPRTTTPASYLDEERFLASVSDEQYRSFLREFFQACRSLDYRFDWGTSGVSVRLPTPDRPEPLTAAWLFQPGRSGWMGLTDVNFGYDPSSANQTPSVRAALDAYVEAIGELEGRVRAKAKNLSESVWHLSPTDATRHQSAIIEAMAKLASDRSASESPR